MRTLIKNKQKVYFQNAIGFEKEIVNGYDTGNKIKVYSEPQSVFTMLSFPKGSNEYQEVGILSKFDKLAITNKDLGIKEQARLFLDIDPVLSDITNEYDNWNYVCTEVITSLNSVIYGLSKRA